MQWVPEGNWSEFNGGATRYLRGPSEGALEVLVDGFKPGQTVRVYPTQGISGRARNLAVRAAVEHMAETTRLRRLNADDKAMWLIGFLWSRGHDHVEFHVELGHRI